MACSLGIGLCISGSTHSKTIQNLGVFSFLGSVQISNPKSKSFRFLGCNFLGQSIVVSDQKTFGPLSHKFSNDFFVNAQSSISVSRSVRWWEKTLTHDMIEIYSAQELVDSLKNAGDRLVVIVFYSPGCGGCRALHPKICQLAESSTDAMFLKINYDELQPMCNALQIPVLPFFRLYRGAEGRLCSFSCTLATIKKLKDALAKYSAERCSLAPAKGLDESELLKLAEIGEISMNSPSSCITEDEKIEDSTIWNTPISLPLSRAGDMFDAREEDKPMTFA
ncbi:hypothetical protein Nepgr_023253 [Nepenthes gracilis]|uniref:Thioredoxin domain-containing protein n=1 Tax=Nepenthes gracilis TaxID=150966 RepID=A0AAD3T3Z8_NEPGR|nr:hypothetical protein Nepgr_023253 [Nepenthes gracilis]